MSENNPEETGARKRPCAGVKQDLIDCLKATDCMLIEHKSAKECLVSNHPSVPQDCYALRTVFFECKRSLLYNSSPSLYLACRETNKMCDIYIREELMLDNRQRFRGRKGY